MNKTYLIDYVVSMTMHSFNITIENNYCVNVKSDNGKSFKLYNTLIGNISNKNIVAYYNEINDENNDGEKIENKKFVIASQFRYYIYDLIEHNIDPSFIILLEEIIYQIIDKKNIPDKLKFYLNDNKLTYNNKLFICPNDINSLYQWDVSGLLSLILK